MNEEHDIQAGLGGGCPLRASVYHRYHRLGPDSGGRLAGRHRFPSVYRQYLLGVVSHAISQGFRFKDFHGSPEAQEQAAGRL